MRRMPLPPPRATRLQAALAGTLGGALGVLAPLWDGADGGALLRLQALLALALPHAAGLNPAAFGRARPLPRLPPCTSSGRPAGRRNGVWKLHGVGCCSIISPMLWTRSIVSV